MNQQLFKNKNLLLGIGLFMVLGVGTYWILQSSPSPTDTVEKIEVKGSQI